MDQDVNVNLSKVPQVTLGFWIVKIMATTLGEVGGNAVSNNLGLGYFWGTVVFFLPLIVAIYLQIKTEKFNSLLYWITITLTTLAGTTLADFCDRSLGIGYTGGSTLLLSSVLVTLFVWYKTLGTVNIYKINSTKSELFYWSTIMFSQTLGTALGDWMADDTGLGYNGSALLIAAVLVVICVLYKMTKVSRTFLFWSAFILTRPLGATFANSLDKPISKGGLGINDIHATGVFAILMIISLFMFPQKSKEVLSEV